MLDRPVSLSPVQGAERSEAQRAGSRLLYIHVWGVAPSQCIPFWTKQFWCQSTFSIPKIIFMLCIRWGLLPSDLTKIGYSLVGRASTRASIIRPLALISLCLLPCPKPSGEYRNWINLKWSSRYVLTGLPPLTKQSPTEDLRQANISKDQIRLNCCAMSYLESAEL